MKLNLPQEWTTFLDEELQQPYFVELGEMLEQEYKQYTIYPPQSMLFRSLELTSFAQSKVMILGQDPYHGKDQAEGLSFSVPVGSKIPPSLRNIFLELHDDVGCELPMNGNLHSWAKQGVLLMNTILSVRSGKPLSHRQLGWQRFTDHVISLLNERKKAFVFILWGNDAQIKKRLINAERHLVISSVHPSPLSAYRGFFGSKPFSLTNEYLRKNGISEIDWKLKTSD